MGRRQTGERRPAAPAPCAAPSAVLGVVVRPGAAREALGPFHDGRLKVAVTAPADRGRANAALLALLARRLGLPKGQLRILRGAGARRKDVLVEGLSTDDLRQRGLAP